MLLFLLFMFSPWYEYSLEQTDMLGTESLLIIFQTLKQKK